MNKTPEMAIGQSQLPNLVKAGVPKSVTLTDLTEGRIRRTDSGFSLIELLIVMAIGMLIATIAVPHLQKALKASENANTYATLRTVASEEISYFSRLGRFGRITEINNLMSNQLGTQSGNDVIHGKYVFSMQPSNPTDGELRNGFTLTATRQIAGDDLIYVYELTQSGEIRQILP